MPFCYKKGNLMSYMGRALFRNKQAAPCLKVTFRQT